MEKQCVRAEAEFFAMAVVVARTLPQTGVCVGSGGRRGDN